MTIQLFVGNSKTNIFIKITSKPVMHHSPITQDAAAQQLFLTCLNSQHANYQAGNHFSQTHLQSTKALSYAENMDIIVVQKTFGLRCLYLGASGVFLHVKQMTSCMNQTIWVVKLFSLNIKRNSFYCF